MYTTGNMDLRTLISDGPQDKYSFRKKVFGIQDGSNTIFKTLDNRRVTDLSSSSAPEGVYVNNVRVSVVSDSVVEGIFTLASPPNNGDTVEASYYSQWFLDVDINTFLTTGVQWCLQISDVTATPDGLVPAVLHFGAAEAYKKLSILAVRKTSETFRVEDAPGKDSLVVAKQFNDMADSELKMAEDLREQYYKRGDQYKAPIFRTLCGHVPSTQPKR